jgi:hypothetical protein
MPIYMPEYVPNKMPEDVSDRMPDDLPVRKYINVMVGITRSKVFFLKYIFWYFIKYFNYYLFGIFF